MKEKYKFWCSSLQPWKLHVKLLIELVVSCSIYQAMEATNARAKANVVSKML